MKQILLDQGSGGLLSHRLIEDLILPAFNNPILSQMNDSAVIEIHNGRIAFTTDSFTVDPLFFPGGNIGCLSIHGTVNDLCMCGATPLYLSAGLIIEEGLSAELLEKIITEMGQAAENAGVKVVTGDTKVVPRGAVDKIYINTSGIGLVPDGIDVSPRRVRPGDRIILSGCIAEHGITILTQRQGLHFDAPVSSDTAPLHQMAAGILNHGSAVHAMRDPTRGGLGATLNEIAIQSKSGIRINEDRIGIKPSVNTLCEILGIDPLYVANEGKLVAFVAPEEAENILHAIRKEPMGKDASIIGEVTAGPPGRVVMHTAVGGMRIIAMPVGDSLPRIC